MTANLAAVAYLVSGVLFILALRGLSSPETSRRGNALGMTGMVLAVVVTLYLAGVHDRLTWGMIIVGVAIGGTIGAIIARRIPMTAMPQLVAAFHSLVGMAAVLVAASALYTPETYGIGIVGSIKVSSLVEMSWALPSALSPLRVPWWLSPNCRDWCPARPWCFPGSIR